MGKWCSFLEWLFKEVLVMVIGRVDRSFNGVYLKKKTKFMSFSVFFFSRLFTCFC